MTGPELERFHAGDEVLFAELVAVYSPRLLPYLRRYVCAGVDAHDLLQDVWLRAYRKRASFEGRGSLFGWLLMVGRTVGLAALAKRGHAPAHHDPRATAGPTDAEAALLGEHVRSAVLDLPERQRDVVLLRVIEGLSTAETAARMECAEGTVKATLHQAIRTLRAALKEKVS
jgi:RNA polymerase sigma-70 factor, ECF subfamily